MAKFVLVQVSEEYYMKLKTNDHGATVMVDHVVLWSDDAQTAVDDANDRARNGEDSDGGERCPGCRAEPGAGLTAGCDDPDGCGYWRQAARGGR